MRPWSNNYGGNSTLREEFPLILDELLAYQDRSLFLQKELHFSLSVCFFPSGATASDLDHPTAEFQLHIMGSSVGERVVKMYQSRASIAEWMQRDIRLPGGRTRAQNSECESL